MSRIAKRYAPIVASIVLSVLTAFVAGEVFMRVFVKRLVDGQALRGVRLAPKDWDALRSHMSEIWTRGSGEELSYLVHDSQIGWKVGPNRRSKNGLYMSGPEGLRVSQLGESPADLPPRRLIAVLGDSFAFGEKVAYHDTFASRLEESLGPEYRVLNFGVPGYGVDQTYLRYLNDARPWNPEIVVFSLVWHDLLRSMSVYSFLAFPGWDMPLTR